MCNLFKICPLEGNHSGFKVVNRPREHKIPIVYILFSDPKSKVDNYDIDQIMGKCNTGF